MCCFFRIGCLNVFFRCLECCLNFFIPVSEGIVGRETGFWNHCVCCSFSCACCKSELASGRGGVSNKKSFLFQHTPFSGRMSDFGSRLSCMSVFICRCFPLPPRGIRFRSSGLPMFPASRRHRLRPMQDPALHSGVSSMTSAYIVRGACPAT